MNRNIAAALAEKRNLYEPEALELLADYGIPVPEYAFAKSKAEAQKIATRLKEPLVFKVVSPDIIHKSDAGGVLLNVKAEDAEKAWDEIVQNVHNYKQVAAILGILIVEQAPKGLECLVGSSVDNQFGPYVMFGLGGIFVELFKDVSLRVMPLQEKDARAMIEQTKSGMLFDGYRGQAPKDKDAVMDVIVKVGKMLQDHPQIQQMDINPLVVYEEGCIALDARVMLL